jgi:imidazolonepropionase-like amidohydrolase
MQEFKVGINGIHPNTCAETGKPLADGDKCFAENVDQAIAGQIFHPSFAKGGKPSASDSQGEGKAPGVKELKAALKAAGVTGYSKWKKPELIAAVEALG